MRNETLAIDYIRLMTPLLPPGRLAVRIIGVPATAEERRAMRRIVSAARVARAHRSDGTAVVEVHFAHESIDRIHPSPLRLALKLEAIAHEDRLRRLWMMACMGALLVLLLRFNQLVVRRRRVAIVGEDVYA